MCQDSIWNFFGGIRILRYIFVTEVKFSDFSHYTSGCSSIYLSVASTFGTECSNSLAYKYVK